MLNREQLDQILTNNLTDEQKDLVLEYLVQRRHLPIDAMTSTEMCALCGFLPLVTDGKNLFPRMPVDQDQFEKLVVEADRALQLLRFHDELRNEEIRGGS